MQVRFYFEISSYDTFLCRQKYPDINNQNNKKKKKRKKYVEVKNK